MFNFNDEYLIDSSDIQGGVIGSIESNDIIISLYVYLDLLNPRHFVIFDSHRLNQEVTKRYARIQFHSPSYVNTNLSILGLSPWILTVDEIRVLTLLLKQKWVSLIYAYNYERQTLDCMQPDVDPSSYTESSDYFTDRNFIKNLKYPNYLPIDLPIPDYSKLSI